MKLHRYFGRKRLILNVKEPTGRHVIKSASGRAVHVAKPRGEAYLSKVGGGGAIKRASAARRRALGDDVTLGQEKP